MNDDKMRTEKKSTYNYDAQKKYNSKSMHIGLKFIESEKGFYEQIETACNTIGCSKQNYIKNAIRDRLVKDGFLDDK